MSVPPEAVELVLYVSVRFVAWQPESKLSAFGRCC
jgi:hypothetical protein